MIIIPLNSFQILWKLKVLNLPLSIQETLNSFRTSMLWSMSYGKMNWWSKLWWRSKLDAFSEYYYDFCREGLFITRRGGWKIEEVWGWSFFLITRGGLQIFCGSESFYLYTYWIKCRWKFPNFHPANKRLLPYFIFCEIINSFVIVGC